MSPAPPPVPSKKRSPLFWVLVVVGALVLVGMVGVGFLGYNAYRIGRRIAGSDNPALAAAKLSISINPDLELVGEDPAAGSLTVRDKKNGKTYRMRLNPQTKAFELQEESGNGSVEFKDGRIVVRDENSSSTVNMAEGGALPSWIPSYPGAPATGHIVAETPAGTTSTFSFKSADGPEKILTFYKEQLQSAGFRFPTSEIRSQGGLLMAEDEGKKRQVMLAAGADGDSVLTITEHK